MECCERVMKSWISEIGEGKVLLAGCTIINFCRQLLILTEEILDKPPFCKRNQKDRFFFFCRKRNRVSYFIAKLKFQTVLTLSAAFSSPLNNLHYTLWKYGFKRFHQQSTLIKCKFSFKFCAELLLCPATASPLLLRFAVLPRANTRYVLPITYKRRKTRVSIIIVLCRPNNIDNHSYNYGSTCLLTVVKEKAFSMKKSRITCFVRCCSSEH